MSYLNMILYSSVLPSYRPPGGGESSPQRHERIDADDPANRDQVRSIIHGR